MARSTLIAEVLRKQAGIGGRAAHQIAGGNGAVGAALVVDDELLVEGLGEFQCHEACDHVGATARRKADQDAHGLGWGRGVLAGPGPRSISASVIGTCDTWGTWYR